MFTRITKVVLGPDTRQKAEQVANHFQQIWETQKGFRGITFFGDSETGEYGALSLWETREDAEASMSVAKIELDWLHKGRYQWEPSFEIFEVHTPESNNALEM